MGIYIISSTATAIQAWCWFWCRPTVSKNWRYWKWSDSKSISPIRLPSNRRRVMLSLISSWFCCWRCRTDIRDRQRWPTENQRSTARAGKCDHERWNERRTCWNPCQQTGFTQYACNIYYLCITCDVGRPFCARQHVSAHMLSQFRPSSVRPSVRLSVRHTGGSVKNGWS